MSPPSWPRLSLSPECRVSWTSEISQSRHLRSYCDAILCRVLEIDSVKMKKLKYEKELRTYGKILMAGRPKWCPVVSSNWLHSALLDNFQHRERQTQRELSQYVTSLLYNISHFFDFAPSEENKTLFPYQRTEHTNS